MISDETLTEWRTLAETVDRRFSSGEPWYATPRERRLCEVVPDLIHELRELRARLRSHEHFAEQAQEALNSPDHIHYVGDALNAIGDAWLHLRAVLGEGS